MTVTGYMPDLRPCFEAAAVAVAPVTYGAGIQNKVLEAMASGVPVVASAQAASALQARPGRDLLVAGAAAHFAEAIVQLLDAPATAQALGLAGREYTLRHHQWAAIAGQLEDLYAEWGGRAGAVLPHHLGREAWPAAA